MLVEILNIWGFRGPLDTFWSPKSLERQIASDLRNWPMKIFSCEFTHNLVHKNYVFLREIKKCSGNDKIISDTVLES